MRLLQDKVSHGLVCRLYFNKLCSQPSSNSGETGSYELSLRGHGRRERARTCVLGGALEGNPSTVKLFFVGLLLSARTHNNHHRRRRHHPHLLPHCFPRFIHVQLAPASLRHSVASAVTSPTLAASSAPNVSLRLSWIKII